MKGYVIIASNGAEVIDTRPEAESLIIAMDEEEQLYRRRGLMPINLDIR